MQDSIRAFIAIEPTEPVKVLVVQLIRQMQDAGLAGVRWVGPEGVHLTLKFLGNVSPAMVEKVMAAMASSAQGQKPFDLALEGLGVFPNTRSPRVLWVGIRGDVGALGRLQERLEAGLERLSFPREQRPFNPHITLGRVREGIQPAERRKIAEMLEPQKLHWTSSETAWRVESLVLMRSTLTPSGAVYHLLGQTNLESPLSDQPKG